MFILHLINAVPCQGHKNESDTIAALEKLSILLGRKEGKAQAVSL